MIDFSGLMNYAYEHRLYDSHVHGLEHWNQVEFNGLLLAPKTGADIVVVRLFALFHDCRRVEDCYDEEHGPRAAEFIRQCREEKLFELDSERFEKLYTACKLHTVARSTGDPTIDTCFDADRLDLGRVGIHPDPARLATAAAKIIATDLRKVDISVYQHRPWIQRYRFK